MTAGLPTDREINRAFGARLAFLRSMLGLSRPRLAERIDKSPEAIRDMERGVNAVRVPDAVRIAAALDVELADLMDIRDRPASGNAHTKALLDFARTAHTADAATLTFARDHLRSLLGLLRNVECGHE